MSDLLSPADPWVMAAQPYRDNCQCRRCRPDLFTIIPLVKQGPQHIAVRFLTDQPSLRTRIRWHVFLDGAEVLDCYEAMAGENGWVAVFVSDDHRSLGGRYRHACARCAADGHHGDDTHPCEIIKYGHVEIKEY